MLNSIEKSPLPITVFAIAVILLAVWLFAPPPTAAWSQKDEVTSNATETAILAGGCFWGMEDLIRKLDGVLDTDVGFATDAEAIRIVFDPKIISYEELLQFYFRMHNPTTKNRQGNDRGAEYRSAIFVLTSDQRTVAEQVRAEVDASGFWKKPVVTEINEAGEFRTAEEHHQDYLEKNPGGYSCHRVRSGSGNG